MLKRVSGAEGFTLVEVLMATVIGLLLMAAVYTGIIGGQQASTGIEQKIAVQEDVRAALDIMATEIAMASFNPLSATSIWVNPNACGGPPLNSAYKGIQAADPNNITIEMDTNQNGVIQQADPNEIISYSYDQGNQMITKNSNCQGALPFIGDFTGVPNVQKNVIVINSTLNPAIPVFRYFDSKGAEITAGQLPANIPQIRRIDITLVVQSVNPDMQGQVRTMVHSTSVIPRNHAIPGYF